MTTKAVEGMSATKFIIPRKANISSDGIPHKVIQLYVLIFF